MRHDLSYGDSGFYSFGSHKPRYYNEAPKVVNPTFNGWQLLIGFFIGLSAFLYVCLTLNQYAESVKPSEAEIAIINAGVDSLLKEAELIVKSNDPAAMAKKAAEILHYSARNQHQGKCLDATREIQEIVVQIGILHDDAVLGRASFGIEKIDIYRETFYQEMARLNKTLYEKPDDSPFSFHQIMKTILNGLWRIYKYFFWFGLMAILLKRSIGLKTKKEYFTHEKYDTFLFFLAIILYPLGVFFYFCRQGKAYKLFQKLLESNLKRFEGRRFGKLKAYAFAFVITVFTTLPRFGLLTFVQEIKPVIQIIALADKNTPEYPSPAKKAVYLVDSFFKVCRRHRRKVIRKLIALLNSNQELPLITIMRKILLFRPRGIPPEKRFLISNPRLGPPFGFDFLDLIKIKTYLRRISCVYQLSL